MKKLRNIVLTIAICGVWIGPLFAGEAAAEKTPITVNADSIEYSLDKTTVTLTGNVDIQKEDTVLTCDKVVFNTVTNDAHAEGNVKLKNKEGLITAKSFDYNFKTGVGQGYDATVFYPPYFGKGAMVRRISDSEIDVKGGYLTTCDKEHPHWRIQTRLMQFFPGDKVKTKAMTFRVGDIPIMYMPKYTQNMKDDRMHVQVTPGKSKDWGLFLLTAWRYDLFSNSGGRVHFDIREKRDIGWGVDNYYDTKAFGKGYFKTYYMFERKLSQRINKYWFKDYYSNKGKGGRPHPPRVIEKERYRMQWRHKWEVNKDSYWLAEYHKLNDVNFIKDYFFREYEKGSQPLSYVMYNTALPDSSVFNMLLQKRTNRIFSETEKLPELKWDKPSTRIYDSPVYFTNSSSYVNFNKKFATVPAPTEEDYSTQRLDNYNRVSVPFKLAFLDFNPFAGSRETYFQRIAGVNHGFFREAWDSGLDVTTRFYRTFEVEGDYFGMKFNKLRHIISPAVNYGYAHPPTISSAKLMQFDGLDALAESNQMALSLENKLQTKRNSKVIDFARLIVSTNYFYNVEGRSQRRWSDDISLDLETLPYDWLRFEADAAYSRKNDYFKTVNLDLKADGKVVSWGSGFRYERRESAQLTGEIIFKLVKGWSFDIYESLQFKRNSLLKEQTYKISKELHCWILDINYNVVRERGETIWFAMRLKAFPETGLEYGQAYHEPKPSSQGYAGGRAAD